MDPEATLQLAEEADAKARAAFVVDDVNGQCDAEAEVREHVTHLCIWLARGGFQPAKLVRRLEALIR